MSLDKVIALIDMDCFYVQCEQRLAPEYWSRPCAVAQYNSWKGGGLIAVNYEARDFGVKRGQRGNDAMNVCPDIHIFSVPEVRGKADLTRYRDASHEVFEAIKQFVSTLDPNIIVEKASIDEAFIDLTQHINQLMDRSEPIPNADVFTDSYIELNEENDFNQWLTNLKDNEFTFADEIRLAFGAVVVQQIRKQILDKTQFKCSAGISHNKMLAKLACAIHKPNAQTILPHSGVEQLWQRTDIKKIRSLGGKLGTQVKTNFKINTMFELKCLEFKDLAKIFDSKTAKWLKNVADGYDEDPVSNRQISKSIGCGKNFPGKTALSTLEDVRYWVKQLSEELIERIARDKEVNRRSPKLMVIGFKFHERDSNSRSLPLDSSFSAIQIADQIMKQLFCKIKLEPIVNLSIAASKFMEETDDPSYNTIKLDNYFKKVDKNVNSGDNNNNSTGSSAPKKLKNNHTKTLEDLWKPSTSGINSKIISSSTTTVSTSTASSSTSSAITASISTENNNDFEISEIKDPVNNSSNKSKHSLRINPWNSKNGSLFSGDNQSKRESNNKMNTNCDNESEKTGSSSNEPIVIDIIDDNMDDIVSEPIDVRNPYKRGFFFRKFLQMRAEEKAREEISLRQRIAAKNAKFEAKMRAKHTVKQTPLERFLNVQSKPK